MIKDKIAAELQRIVKDLTGEEVAPQIDHPADERHGDYSTNIAMAMFSSAKFNTKKLFAIFQCKVQSSKFSSPLELAKEIAKKFTVHSSPLRQSFEGQAKFKVLDRVEVAPPGFVNFWLSSDYLLNSLISIDQDKENFGHSKNYHGKKIMVEYTDPNPFKEFHIGHLYSNAVGESLSRLFEAGGGSVARADYYGDVGMHVAKALYGLHLVMPNSFRHLDSSGNKILKHLQCKQVQDDTFKVQDDTIEKLETLSLAERVKFMGKAYALGSKAFEEDKAAAEEIKRLNKVIFVAAQELLAEKTKEKPVIDYYQGASIDENELEAIKTLFDKGRSWSLEYFETIYSRLGTKFDYYYPESEVGEYGAKLVSDHLDKVFEKSDGAIVYRGESVGLHTRVFINQLGLPTYEAKELGLNYKKYQDYPFDQSFIVTGGEIKEYFRVLLAVMEKIIPEVAAKTIHIGHGMVRLPTGKMSSRTGKVLTGEWLLNEAKSRIQSAYPEMDEETSEKVAVGAVKYALLKSGIGKDIEFDFKESVSFEGNSGPYLQYTYARIQSVLRKSQAPISKFQTNFKFQISNFKLEPEEQALLRALHRFPEVVEEAAENYAPNLLCNYLFDLAQKFNLFYQKHPILSPVISIRQLAERNPQGISQSVSFGDLPRDDKDDKNEEIRDFRLALTAGVGQVIKNGLRLLGIETPTKM